MPVGGGGPPKGLRKRQGSDSSGAPGSCGSSSIRENVGSSCPKIPKKRKTEGDGGKDDVMIVEDADEEDGISQLKAELFVFKTNSAESPNAWFDAPASRSWDNESKVSVTGDGKHLRMHHAYNKFLFLTAEQGSSSSSRPAERMATLEIPFSKVRRLRVKPIDPMPSDEKPRGCSPRGQEVHGERSALVLVLQASTYKDLRKREGGSASNGSGPAGSETVIQEIAIIFKSCSEKELNSKVNKVPKLAVLKVTGSSPTGASNKSRAGRGGTRAPSPVTKPAEQDDKFLFMMYERWREVAGGDNGADMRASGCAGEDGLGIDADKSMKDGEGVGFGGSSVPRAGQSVKVVTAAASSPAGSNSMQLSSSAGKAAAATACGAACLSDQQAQNAHEVSDSAVQAAASQQGAAAAAVSSEIGLEEGEGSRRATRQSTASSHAEAGGRDTPKGGRETPTHTTSVERQQPTEEKKSAEAPGDVLFVYPFEGGGTDSITVTRADLATLQDQQELNDTVMDFYIKYIERKVLTDHQREQCHFFSTFFWKRLSQEKQQQISPVTNAHARHAGVAKWTRKVDLFSKRFLFVPICDGMHWTLAVVCAPNGIRKLDDMASQDDLDDGCWVDYPDETGKPSKQKHITLYFDSLGAHKKVQKEAIEFLADYLRVEWQKRRPGGKDSGKVSSDVRDGVKLGADGEGEARGEEQSEVPGMYGMYEGPKRLGNIAARTVPVPNQLFTKEFVPKGNGNAEKDYNEWKESDSKKWFCKPEPTIKTKRKNIYALVQSLAEEYRNRHLSPQPSQPPPKSIPASARAPVPETSAGAPVQDPVLAPVPHIPLTLKQPPPPPYPPPQAGDDERQIAGWRWGSVEGKRDGVEMDDKEVEEEVPETEAEDSSCVSQS